MSLYTKDGRPLEVSGNSVFGPSGREIGQIRGDKVYGPDGGYVGTIAGDRLVFRSTDSAGVSSSFASARRVGSSRASAIGSAIWGDEPDIGE